MASCIPVIGTLLRLGEGQELRPVLEAHACSEAKELLAGRCSLSHMPDDDFPERPRV